MDFSAQLSDLRTDYLCGKPVKLLSFNLLASCTWDQQAELLRHTVNAPVTLQHGNLSRAYRTAFIRRIIAELEARNTTIADNDGVHDDIYVALAATLCVDEDADEDAALYAWRHFELWRAGSSHCISIRQRLHIISGGTTGLHTWQAAGALAEWAISETGGLTVLHGRRVLELGSGTGLTGLVVAKVCQPRTLVLTDGNEQVLELLRSNVVANGFNAENENNDCSKRDGEPQVLVGALDWDAVHAMSDVLLSQCGGPPDVILAADVVYDETLFVPLCRALDALFCIHATATATMAMTTTMTIGCCAILAATVRNADTLQQFLTQLGTLHFQYAELHVPAPRVLYWDDATPIKIFRITRPCATAAASDVRNM